MFLFCFMLSICLFSLPTYTVEAEQSETTNHGEHTDWNVLTCDGGELESGSYYLNEDIIFTQNITIEGEVTLCLNGYMLAGNGNGASLQFQAEH